MKRGGPLVLAVCADRAAVRAALEAVAAFDRVVPGRLVDVLAEIHR